MLQKTHTVVNNNCQRCLSKLLVTNEKLCLVHNFAKKNISPLEMCSCYKNPLNC